jgi:hypothetical protein
MLKWSSVLLEPAAGRELHELLDRASVLGRQFQQFPIAKRGGEGEPGIAVES